MDQRTQVIMNVAAATGQSYADIEQIIDGAFAPSAAELQARLERVLLRMNVILAQPVPPLLDPGWDVDLMRGQTWRRSS